MEVKVEVGLSKGLENIMNRFISAIEGAGTSGIILNADQGRPVNAVAHPLKGNNILIYIFPQKYFYFCSVPFYLFYDSFYYFSFFYD